MFEIQFLDEDYVARVEAALQKRYGRYLKEGETFRVSGEPSDDAWTVCVTFENADRSLHLPVEAALLAEENPKTTSVQARDVLLDFIDYYFDRYFKGARHVTLPIDWKVFPFGEYTVRARGWERNLMLEELADRLLAGEPVDKVMARRNE